jgi:hypothetical protein
MDHAAQLSPQLDDWLPDAAVRVEHRRASTVSPAELWNAAREVRLSETAMLGRLLRLRIPGLAPDLSYDALFREPPFVVLDEGERSLISGLVGRIWTLRRDYPELHSADEFRDWAQSGTARVVFGHWAQDGPGQGATLVSEARVQPIGAQGRIGLMAVRTIVRTFQHLVGSEGIRAAVRRAESA